MQYSCVHFSSGANPGECANQARILSNAEIQRYRSTNSIFHNHKISRIWTCIRSFTDTVWVKEHLTSTVTSLVINWRSLPSVQGDPGLLTVNSCWPQTLSDKLSKSKQWTREHHLYPFSPQGLPAIKILLPSHPLLLRLKGWWFYPVAQVLRSEVARGVSWYKSK